MMKIMASDLERGVINAVNKSIAPLLEFNLYDEEITERFCGCQGHITNTKNGVSVYVNTQVLFGCVTWAYTKDNVSYDTFGGKMVDNAKDFYSGLAVALTTKDDYLAQRDRKRNEEGELCNV